MRDPIRETVANYITLETFYLTSLDSHFTQNQSIMEQIVAVCNQAEVYEFLFKRRLNGEPYSIEQANAFIKWAKEGWSSNKWFVFIIMTSDEQVAGAIDIRSSDIDGAEIGYWLNNKFSGVMTNTVLKLLDLAKQAQFKRLIAWVEPTNGKSSSVLERAGFAKNGLFDREQRQMIQYEITLD